MSFLENVVASDAKDLSCSEFSLPVRVVLKDGKTHAMFALYSYDTHAEDLGETTLVSKQRKLGFAEADFMKIIPDWKQIKSIKAMGKIFEIADKKEGENGLLFFTLKH